MAYHDYGQELIVVFASNFAQNLIHDKNLLIDYNVAFISNYWKRPALLGSKYF